MGLNIDDDTWPNARANWKQHLQFLQILSDKEIAEPPKVTLEEIINRSDDFPIQFPTNSSRSYSLASKVDRKSLEDNANSVYVLLHEQALHLYASFLYQKRRFGNKIELDLYQNMTVVELVDRLLTKRAVAFAGVEDEYLLIDKTEGKGNWESIGAEETFPLTLQNCLSYDEIKLAALLSVSSLSYFLDDKGEIKGHGIITGAVGARLEKEKVMEYREVMKTEDQNTHTLGYGQFFVPTMQGVFTNFYGDISLTYEELQWRNEFQNEQRYLKLDENKYFDRWVYKRRIALSIDMLLMEANDRAKKVNKKACLYVIGLGLGEWQIASEQDQLFFDVLVKRIQFLGKFLQNINQVFVSNVKIGSVYKKIQIDSHPDGGICVSVENWSVNGLKQEDEGKLMIISYNWNGNALPGNEYWLHKWQSDGSLAANSSQIAEIQNPFINKNIQGNNLRIVTTEGLIPLKDYVKKYTP